MKTVRGVLVPVLAVTAVCAIVAGILDGLEGILGAVLGGLAVVLFLGSTPLILSPLVKASANFSLASALAFFATKGLAMLIILVLLFDVGSAADHVSTMAFGVAAIAASLAWTGLQVLAFGKGRVPTYDLRGED